MVQPDPLTPPAPRTLGQQLARLHREGRHADLERVALAALERDPAQGALWKVLGVARAALGRIEASVAAKRRAAELLPDDAEAHANLANGLAALGQRGAAQAAFRRALVLDRRFAHAWAGLGRLLWQQGRLSRAELCLTRAVQCRPASAEAHNELGNLRRERGRVPEAEPCYREALRLQPDLAEAWSNLGNTLADLGRAVEALACYDRALSLRPGIAQVHSNRANLLKDVGRLDEALAAYRSAVHHDPDFLGARSNLLLALNHDPGLQPQAALGAAQAFGAFAQSRAGTPLASTLTERLPGDRLRVGWVSGDLRTHPVAYFLEPLLAHLDPTRFSLHAYPSVLVEDTMTQRLKPRFDHWTPIARLDDAQAATRIAQDRLHVLVDLSGHTAHNRLGVFARRPAPVQISWLGYFGTTGLPTMDWLVADPVGLPPPDAAHYSERIAWLPDTRMCFGPPHTAPPVAPLPALREPVVTFGSFQSPGRLPAAVLDLWARVLHAVPASRLRLQTPLLADEAVRAALREAFARRGIAPGRLLLSGKTSRTAYLRAYADVDLVLDTFPYSGGTTTCEALWMGVPVLTLPGNSLLARQGAALLSAAGLPEWIARDAGDFVDKAAAAAADLQALSKTREGLRARLAGSALCDAPRFAGHFASLIERLASGA